ncbi:hypothetical protein KTR10_01765 [Candidatus Kaiserbacteria bacterium]|nr:hypothetical protein [Candidatus Kaiserbacteria bacterium]
MNTVATTPMIAKTIAGEIVRMFRKEHLSILLYGSSLNSDSFWDLDILVIKKEKQNVAEDLRLLREVVEIFSEHELDLQLFYSDEIGSADLFSLDAHGAFFSYVLADAITLHGENPFTEFRPSEQLVTTSLLNRIQRYIFQYRREAMGIGRHVRDKNPQYHQKHVRRVLMDLMLFFGPCSNTQEAEEKFRVRFPHVFSDTQWTWLEKEDAVDSAETYIDFYETLYQLALKTSYMLTPRTIQRPARTFIGGMITEYILPEKFSKAIIVIDGLPRTPVLDTFLNLLASWGYAVFFPRLKGTWESEGVFLDHNPAEDIQELAELIQGGINVDGQTVHTEHITVLGASFGGLVALYAGVNNAIDRVIALSPVYAMSQVPDIDTLKSFMQRSFGVAYRFTDADWSRLVNDEILSLEAVMQHSSFRADKYHILAGENDRQIPIETLQQICRQAQISVTPLPTEHLSFHKKTSRIFPALYSILNPET